MMAGYLSNINNGENTLECWKDVAKRVDFPIEITQMESLSTILSISYNDLSQHLNACFINMVNFSKNFEIYRNFFVCGVLWEYLYNYYKKKKRKTKQH